jgi:hypothetical protein
MSTNEWYTRPKYIEAACLVMDGIDLDPASCAAANEIVKATRYFTEKQNGLLQEWKARSLWFNPPYARTATYHSGIRHWVEKALQSYQSGDIEQAILLLTTEVNAQWFQPLWEYPICFADHRVKFLAPVLDPRGVYNHMFGTCFVYLGPHEERFAEVFSQFGRIVKAIDTPKAKPVTRELWLEVAG